MVKKVILAIIWTMCLITNICAAIANQEPSWVITIGAVAILVLRLWLDCFDENVR